MVAASPIKPVTTGPPRALTAFCFLAAAGAIATVLGSQLKTSKSVMDSRFAQYNTPASEANRKKAFEGAQEDPRTSIFNVLGWRS